MTRLWRHAARRARYDGPPPPPPQRHGPTLKAVSVPNDAGVLAAHLLFSTRPTDRALAGWRGWDVPAKPDN